MHDSSTTLQFGIDTRQRQAASELGIWLFLATEVLFFGGMFTSYTFYRVAYPEAFTIAARETELILGAVNTAILLTSSFLVAVAVKVDRTDERLSQKFLIGTVILGLAFLAVKTVEYIGDIEQGLIPGSAFPLSPGETQIFWALYWLMTGVHALHVIAGMGVLTALYLLRRMGRLAENSAAMEVGALYWHLVDMIWIFLFPILYLVGRS